VPSSLDAPSRAPFHRQKKEERAGFQGQAKKTVRRTQKKKKKGTAVPYNTDQPTRKNLALPEERQGGGHWEVRQDDTSSIKASTSRVTDKKEKKRRPSKVQRRERESKWHLKRMKKSGLLTPHRRTREKHLEEKKGDMYTSGLPSGEGW